MTRAEKAGRELGKVIVEMIHLMYQRKTALMFLRGVTVKLYDEAERRAKELEE